MRLFHPSTLLALALLTLLGACASIDLKKEGSGLSEQDRAIAQEMAELVAQRCSTHLVRVDTGKRYSGDVKFNNAADIRRLYVSKDVTWYKADAVAEGAWDSVYYNQRSGFFVCGEKNWSAIAQLKGVTFDEVARDKTQP